MTDRRLVAMNYDAAQSSEGSLVIMPRVINQTALGIPVIQVEQTLPAAGAIIGEVVLVKSERRCYIWDGVVWSTIAPEPLQHFPDEATMNAAPAVTGQVATTDDTHHLFAAAGGTWHREGIRTYPTVADMNADPAPEGTIGVSSPEGFFVRRTADWMPVSSEVVADVAAADALGPTAGQGHRVYIRTERRFGFTDANRFHYQGFRFFPNEASLRLALAPEGTFAAASDSRATFIMGPNGWEHTGGWIIASRTEPQPPMAAGMIWLDIRTGSAVLWDGTRWRSFGRPIIGRILKYPSIVPPPNCLLCDGGLIPPQYPELIALIGPNLPDLRDKFIRGTNDQTRIDGFASRNDTTRMPRNTLVTAPSGRHRHTWISRGHEWNHTAGASSQNIGSGDRNDLQQLPSSFANDHTHNIVGGDPETAPMHVRLAFHMRAA
jgi:hypothetical protein